MSDRITFTAENRHLNIIDEIEQKEDINSTAAAVRECIEYAEELKKENESLKNQYKKIQEDYEKLKKERDNLQKQLQKTNSRIDDVKEVVSYVEKERELQQKRKIRKEKKESAPIWKRAKWKIFGVPIELENGRN